MTASATSVHVLYGGADRYKEGTYSKLCGLAQAFFDLEWRGKETDLLSPPIAVTGDVVEHAALRTRTLLSQLAVQDFRIDFEDGFGARSSSELFLTAERIGDVLSTDVLPKGAKIGIRIPPLTHESSDPLNVVSLVTAPLEELPPGFCVTHPKVTHTAQLRKLDAHLTKIEGAKGWTRGSIGIEAMYESVTDIKDWRAGCGGRLKSIHFGAYDYLSGLGVPSFFQTLDHPLVISAKMRLIEHGASEAVPIYDGATLKIPQSGHGDVTSAIKAHSQNVWNALRLGLYQGWDVHPHQIPSRIMVLMTYFRMSLADNVRRLSAYYDGQLKASRVGQDFDDAASVRGLEDFFKRGLSVGAFDQAELVAMGLTWTSE